MRRGARRVAETIMPPPPGAKDAIIDADYADRRSSGLAATVDCRWLRFVKLSARSVDSPELGLRDSSYGDRSTAPP